MNSQHHTFSIFKAGIMNFKNMSVKTKILILCIGAVLLTTLTLCSAVVFEKRFLEKDVHSELIVLGKNEPIKSPRTSITCAKCRIWFY